MSMPSRASAFATFMEFVIHPVGFRTNAGPATSVHHSPTRHWSPTTLTTPSMSRISRIIHKPQLLACADCSCRKNLSPSICCLYNSHTKVRCCIPSRASALHRSGSLDKFYSCENAAQRGDRTSTSDFSSIRLMRSASLLKSYPVRKSIAVPGRKTNRLALTVNRLGHEISATCVSVCPRAAINMLRSKQSLNVHVISTSTTAGTSIGIATGTDSTYAALCSLR